MKRWTQDECGMIPDANGEYIRYEDHCEAMKRIAGEGRAIYQIWHVEMLAWSDVQRDRYDESQPSNRRIVYAAPPEQSRQMVASECDHDWIANKAYPLSDNAPEVCSKCWVGRHEISAYCPSCGHPFGVAAPAPSADMSHGAIEIDRAGLVEILRRRRAATH